MVNKNIKVSAKAAIDDVLTLKKYSDIKPLAAGVLYSKFKDVDNYKISGDFEEAIFTKLENLELVENTKNGEYFKLTEYGKEFIRAVNGRKSTLWNKKYGTELFSKK